MDKLFDTHDQETFQQVSEQIIKNLYKHNESSTSSTTQIEQAKLEIRALLSRNNFDWQKFGEDIKKRDWDQLKQNLFLSLLNDNKMEILYSALVDYNSSHGDFMTDFDWSVKLVVGTSESKSLRYPLVQLKLNTSSKISDTNVCFLDLRKEDLDKVIQAIEVAID